MNNMAQPATADVIKATQFARFLRFVIDAVAIVFDRFGAKECISAVEQQSQKLADHFTLVITALQTGQDLALVPKQSEPEEVSEPAPETPLLEFVASKEVGAVAEFDIGDHYRKNNPYGVKVTYVGDNFKKIFGKKTEKNVAATTLKAHRLTRGAKDPEIIKNLGTGHATFLAWLWELLLLQPNGPDSLAGILLTNGYANILEVPNPDNPEDLWAVGASWHGGGWGFVAYPVSLPHGWRAGSQVFSCSVADSSAL